MNELTLYNLMGEDHKIYANLCYDREVHVTIENESDEEVYNQESHMYAWDSLVYFAQQVIDCNVRIQNQLNTQE